MIMKKITLFSISLMLGCATMFAADPPAKDISSILLLDKSFSLGKDLSGENGTKGCVADFNADGVDDFILTGLYISDSSTDPVTLKGFMRVYLGQKSGVPTLAYNDEDFKVVGNGAIDCQKLDNGSFLVALQGGSGGNWTNPFKGQVYNLNVTGNEADFVYVTDLDYGAGRNSILFLDMNNDGLADIFQGGWSAVNSWDARTNIYINDNNDWFEFTSYSEGTEPIRPANNTFVVKGDLNNDGKIDILQPIQGVGLFAYFNNGDETFTEHIVTPFLKDDRTDGMNIRNEEDGTQADLIDFDGDGFKDIVLIGTNDGTGSDWEFIVKLFKNNGGDGTFTEIEQKDLKGNATTFVGGQRGDIAVGDFNNDGNMDFIIGAENQNDALAWLCRTFLFIGNGQGGFEQTDITFSETNANGVVAMSRRANFGRFLVGDFNGDKKKDLITAGTNYYAKDQGVRIYFNAAQGQGIDENTNDNIISISVDGNTVNIKGATNNARVEVYSLSGLKLLETTDSQFNLCVAGLYIVKVENKTEKIVIR